MSVIRITLFLLSLRARCFLGFHRWRGMPAPYYVRCERCGKKDYVGP